MNCLYCNNKLTKCDFLKPFYKNPLQCSHCNYTLVNSSLHGQKTHFISIKTQFNNSFYEILIDYIDNSTTISKFKLNNDHLVDNIVKLTSTLNITPSSAPDKLKTILTFL